MKLKTFFINALKVTVILISLCVLKKAICKKCKTQWCFECEKIWNTPPLSSSENETVKAILQQPFYFFDKGTQTVAFISKDKKYIIKFLRCERSAPFYWIRYFKNKIKNKKQLKTPAETKNENINEAMQSYVIASNKLKEQTALIYLHINKTNNLNSRLKLHNKNCIPFSIDPNNAPFILQKKAELIIPSIKKWMSTNNQKKAETALSNLINLLFSRYKMGILDIDPKLDANYGFMDENAIQIDIGSFKYIIENNRQQTYVNELIQITKPLRNILIKEYPTLANHVSNQILICQKNNDKCI